MPAPRGLSCRSMERARVNGTRSPGRPRSRRRFRNATGPCRPTRLPDYSQARWPRRRWPGPSESSCRAWSSVLARAYSPATEFTLRRDQSHLIEDGPRGEVELGAPKRPRGHEQRRDAEAEAAADQRLEQGSAGAGDAHRHAASAARTCRRCGRHRLEESRLVAPCRWPDPLPPPVGEGRDLALALDHHRRAALASPVRHVGGAAVAADLAPHLLRPARVARALATLRPCVTGADAAAGVTGQPRRATARPCPAGGAGTRPPASHPSVVAGGGVPPPDFLDLVRLDLGDVRLAAHGRPPDSSE